MPMIYTTHAPETEKLEAVKAEMQVFGAPVIRVVNRGDYYRRRRAATALPQRTILA